MKLLAIGAAVGVLMAAGAALADPMASAYGNTVVLTYPGDVKVKLYVNADGTYESAAPDGATASGTWSAKDGQTCFTQTAPQAQPASCSPTVEKKVGDSWTSTGQGGAPITITIVAGRP